MTKKISAIVFQPRPQSRSDLFQRLLSRLRSAGWVPPRVGSQIGGYDADWVLIDEAGSVPDQYEIKPSEPIPLDQISAFSKEK